ncbi:MAG: DUF917 domain-containing protein [Anaerolineae bacterium]|nr:DUF917 domain-containing protein [Anaerolineae bacterium]
MERLFTLNDTQAAALGAGILGTGGGGNTYVGQTWLEKELRDRGGGCRIIDADSVPDDALVCCVGTMGAPTVSNEKLLRGDEFVVGVRALEDHLKARIGALLISEIGGSNALKPLIAGLQLNLPVVDGDPMGRAFPELQMDTFAIGGVSLSPFALVDSHGNVVIMDHVDSPQRAESYARALTIEMGGSAALMMPVVTGRVMKQHLIRGTLSLAEKMGHAILAARAGGHDPAETVAALGSGRVLFRGKITDIERRTVQGFARGRMRLAGFGAAAGQMEIVFQNENLIAWQDGRIICTVPDLICVLSLDDGEPIGTESLRYGLRVAVIGMPAARELKTPAALAFVGPAAFGYPDVTFAPMPGDLL